MSECKLAINPWRKLQRKSKISEGNIPISTITLNELTPKEFIISHENTSATLVSVLR
jgi:hypothetical protein